MDKPGVELDKFKRRLIRAVARLLLQEKKPEDEVFRELKKETGCDCELLWTRMRALTLKKLDRLLFADDRMNTVPKPARMSLTDWLLFDLVLVHQKVDVIGQNSSKTKDLPALVELFELVKMFRLENMPEDKLADAWSLATLSYNNKGHHCSPMLLQRRWYQLKELTRNKFYEYWYAYRGSVQRVSLSEPYKPSPLQTEIARHFKLIVTQPMDSWEELVEKGKIVMPDEFEKKMQERLAMRRPYVPPKPRDDGPDLVMIEPRIETIDLGQQSDEEEDKQEEEEGEIPVPPLVPIVKVKQEPLDDTNIDETQVQPSQKKSIYEVVLESTALENEQIDSIDADDFNPEYDDANVEEVEETPIRYEEVSMLPQICNVFGNVSDTSMLAKIDKNISYVNTETSKVCNNDHAYAGNDEVRNVDVVSQTIVLDNVDGSARDNDTNTDHCEIIANNSAPIDEKESDANSALDNIKVIEVSGSVKTVSSDKNVDSDKNVGSPVEDASDTIGDTNTADDENVSVPDDVNLISDDEDEISGNAEASLTGNIDKVSVTAEATETTIPSNLDITAFTVSDDDEMDEISGNADASLTGKVDEVSVISKVAETTITSVIDETTVTGNVDETHVSEKDKDESKPAASENETIADAQINFPTIVAALKAPTISSTVTESPSKDVEIIETPTHPLVIIPSDDEDDNNIRDDLVKTGTDSALGDEVRPSIDQPMEVDSTPAVVDITSPETLKVELKGDAVTVGDTKPDITGFNFGELPHDISFVDDGIEFVDDGIVYVDEDADDEPKNKNEDEDTPKIDAKLLMCPIVYTTRLDDMYMFHRKPFDHVTDKHLLDDICKKSKPIKQEPKETVENVTINYLGENIESVTVNNTKTVEHIQKTHNVIENVSINNDNIVIIKKEPVNVHGETDADVENNPENGGNVTSDDDDCHENVIDDSQRVKPTSYLLQRPRTRIYTPIQLCKNPDFNTRLKRLSAGLLSSPRNRLLIKSCKPLTIDLSNAFESKLISGTLYLKPADQNVVTEIVDNTQRQNVSVLPSALPAQSLIDNSKDADIIPMLQQCLEASKQPIQPQPQTIPTTTERNKVINLPDITEIRRINQRLLTAEVTPIQVHNNEPQVPVTIVATLNTPTSTAQTTIAVPETGQVLQSRVSIATDARGPPNLLDITDDYPPKSNNGQPTAHSYNNTHTSTGRNIFDTFRPRFNAIVPARQPRMQHGKRIFPLKASSWKPRQFRPEIPWLSRTSEPTKVSVMTNETLLTLDALNKMLFLLTKNLEPEEIGKKNKQKGKRKGKWPGRGQAKTNSDSGVPANEGEANDMQYPCSQKPKFNIKSATNYPPDKEKNDENSKKKVKYCCWAKQRMLQMLFCRDKIPKHECPRVCGCCCRHLLADYIMHDRKMKSAEEKKNSVVVNPFGISEPTVASQGTQTIEEIVDDPVQIASQVPAVETVPEDTVVVDVDAINIKSTTTTNTESTTYIESTTETTNIESTTETTNVESTTMTTNTAVTIENELTNTAVTIENEPIPIEDEPIAIEDEPIAIEDEPIAIEHESIAIENIEGDVPPLGGEVSVETTVVQPPSDIPRGIAVPVTVRRNLVAVPIPKDTNNVLREKPKACVGTNVPPTGRRASGIPKPAIRVTRCICSDKQSGGTVTILPNNTTKTNTDKHKSKTIVPGVHLILLADGTISYKIDHDMEVNAMDIAEMPKKIAALQEHMYLHGAQEIVKRKNNAQKFLLAPVQSEIVDLVDDDDGSVSTVKDHQNTETPLGTEIQTAEEVGTINIVDSPDVSLNCSDIDTSKNSEHDSASQNINSNVNTETESSQNKTVDQCTVIDIQEDVQERSQNEMAIVASAEQEKSDPSIEKVNAEIDENPNPSNQTENTVVREVSAGQEQDQPEQSGQNLSTEALDHPEIATQNVSTEKPEEGRSEASTSKTKNILSDLMEMSGIFDEDMTPEAEETDPAQSVEPVSLPETPSASSLPPDATKTPRTQPIITSVLNTDNIQTPTISSPLGELTPITSLYELKYACANKGVFFKLDFNTGYLVPINVCMKPALPKPVSDIQMRIVPKSVIDLTDDDDKQEPIDNQAQKDNQEQTDKQIEISPTKRSLLLANNSPPSGFTGPVKPVKLFKALKPSILRRLSLSKIQRDSINPLFDKNSINHTIKRKQFLKSINMNADLSANINANNPVRRYIRRMKDPNDAVQEPKPTSSTLQPAKQFATTILSDDESSDDEPLAKIAKRKHENAKALEKENNTCDSVVEPEASVEMQIEPGFPVADAENNLVNNDLVDEETPVEEQNEAELATAADTEPVYMSEDETDFMDHEASFGIDLNENNEEEDCCILGV
ncbi:hypothetical protein PYW07_009494 [Mythimna separata]|uniref:Uncharacterized protein n=1 Tax=Mythimna separata TaxID=271217 RepID=A0AAD7YBM3_MYTSE|nr:hypothetical protein PYW07_009494 [Mythimna separata]